MDVKIPSGQRRRHQTETPPWSTYRHPHQRPLEPGWWPGPWNDVIPEDAECTPLPADDDRPIKLDGPFKPPREGYDWATPFTVVQGGDPGYRTVYAYKEQGEGLLELLAALLGVGRTKHRIPIVSESRLPWVGGHPQDPPSGGDRHYIVVDPETSKMFEAGVTRLGINPSNPFGSQRWWFSRVTEWDLSQPYEAQASKHKGACAARVPMLTITARFDEFERGHIDHAIGVGLPRYQPGPPVWPAMGTDGRLVRDQHGVEVREVPVRAGQRMRLRRDVFEAELAKVEPGSHRWVLLHALRSHGLFPADTSARNHGSSWIAPDGRFEGSNLTGFSLPISAFEAVNIAN